MNSDQNYPFIILSILKLPANLGSLRISNGSCNVLNVYLVVIYIPKILPIPIKILWYLNTFQGLKKVDKSKVNVIKELEKGSL